MKGPASISLVVMLALSSPAIDCSGDGTVKATAPPVKGESVNPLKYPRIVIYSVSWCPHCREAKEYLTSHQIPFINRDVELDSDAMTDLQEKYKSDSVPLFVLGNDERIVKGFKREDFEETLKEMGR